ncbi:MAG: zinc-dependent metalloprotease [Vicinamibacterales bacterium]
MHSPHSALRIVTAAVAVLVATVTLTTVPFKAQGRQAPGSTSSIEERTSSMQKLDGFVPLYWDERAGALFIEIPRFDAEFLLTTGLAAGLGSNDLGLDRGQSGGGRVVMFQRVGPKVLLVQTNQAFRSTSANPAERKSVEDSFAKSVLWGFTVAAESNGRVLVDASEFLLRDIHGAADGLRPGTYRVDRARSVFHMPRTKAFPKNTEVETTLTFTNEVGAGRGGGGGPADGPDAIGTAPVQPTGGRGLSRLFSGSVASVSPNAQAVTLRQHVSFVELPDAGYRPRLDDPRAGYGGISFVDYSVPIGDNIQQRWIRRHRLEKKDPAAAISEPVTPIRYWVDPGAPEDVRKALLEGASWWNQAFEAAGFRNAFKVDVLPADADPMDIRYNMINWVHRSTRGWSSGSTVTDPRTGEILKATVTLGSLRDRQDYLIFEGLLSPYATGTERPQALYDTALMRIRQLAAHETGHTLGLSHNYYDSAKGWISVMDYPHPLEELRPDGTIDISRAYPQRIGDWDKIAINYGYRQLAPGANEPQALTRILDEAWAQDLRFLTNQDMDANPRADWWSNGANQADELNRLLKVRRAALDRLGERTIRAGMPMATIEEPLVPVYMYHRWAVEAAASIVAGQNYVYGIRGDNRIPTQWASAEDQGAALVALSAALRPSELTIPASLLGKIPPRPPAWERHRELFPRTTGDTFDPLTPAMIAADVTIGFVLQIERAARLVAQHAVDPTLPGLDDVLERLQVATFGATAASSYEAEVRRVEERVFVDRVMWLAWASPNPQVRAFATARLAAIADRLRTVAGADSGDRAAHALLVSDIQKFLERPSDPSKSILPPQAPPGAPIGDLPMDWLAPAPWR